MTRSEREGHVARARGESQGTRGIVRGALLAAWCLVLWGSIVLLATTWALVTRGGGAAWSAFLRLSPVDQVLAAVALFAWALVAWGVLDRRRAPA